MGSCPDTDIDLTFLYSSGLRSFYSLIVNSSFSLINLLFVYLFIYLFIYVTFPFGKNSDINPKTKEITLDLYDYEKTEKGKSCLCGIGHSFG